ncbi:hypothetical protein [Photobacterium kishitanii]|uniref:hypothetical protein n=1 Tax=Photobacterium kishitanii TaxID=318456 RepID=UPI002739B70B|nr:hypothetical protein [Photobacterium kishitanii]
MFDFIKRLFGSESEDERNTRLRKEKAQQHRNQKYAQGASDKLTTHDDDGEN